MAYHKWSGNLLIILATSALCQSQTQTFSCQDIPGYAFDPESAAGVWYEVMRFPKSDIPACLNATAPAKVNGTTYELQLEYIFNPVGVWEPRKETVAFPWNNHTQMGIFELSYGSGKNRVDITFKIMQIQYDSVAILCGYSPMAAYTGLIKVMSRTPQLSAATDQQIQAIVKYLGLQKYITAVEQTNCNVGSRLQALHYLPIMIMGVYKILFSN